MANVQVEISAKIDQFQKKLDEAKGDLKSFATDAGSSLKSLGTAIQSIAIPAGVAAAAIAAIGFSAVKSYGRLQSLEKGLAAVAGSTDAAKKQLDDLREVAALPGLGLEEAIRGSISLQAIGISADEAKRSILQFGNAVATVGKGRAELDRALYGLQQLANTDFPLGEDLNIIKDAIPQVSKLLTEAFGANRSDELAKLGITSKQVVETILTGLEGLPRVAGGVENAVENMQDSITEAWQELGKAINETLGFEEATNRLGDAVGGLTDWFRGLDPEVRKAIIYIGAGTAAFLGLIAALGAIITIAPVVAGAITAMTAGVAAITTAIGLAATSIIVNWSKMSYIITEISSDMLSMLSSTANGIAGMFSFIGRQDLAIPFVAAQAALSASAKDLSDKADIMRFEMHEATKEIADLNTEATNAISSATGLSGALGKGADEAKRMGLEIYKLNGILSLNGKAFDPNKRPTPVEPLRQLDRNITLDIPEVQFGKIYTDSEIAGIEAAERFSEFFNENINIGDMIGQGIGNIASTIGDAIGKGGNVIEAFGRGVLGAFGDFLSEFGEKLIAYGIAASAFAKLQLALLNPATALIAAPLAIAAGVALMIAGAAATSAATGRSAGQGSMGFSDTTTGTIVEPRQSQGGMELVLRGGDLYRMNKQYEKSLGYGG